jgi:hypothetical protein
MKPSDIVKRIDEILAISTRQNDGIYARSSEIAQGTVSLLSLIYGRSSAQLQQLNAKLTEVYAYNASPDYKDALAADAAQGVLRNLKREIESGLTGNLRQQITGEVLSDLIQLSKAALDEKNDGAKNVAAVLAAAAFEDTIRRMGETFVGVIGQDDLSEVLKKLKDADVIRPPQIGIAQSYLSFRNHALHANWDKIGRESVQSALGFVEQLLIKHFS